MNDAQQRSLRWGNVPEGLTERDRRQVELFRRFLRGDRSHIIVAWALGEPATSANDPDSYGMGT